MLKRGRSGGFCNYGNRIIEIHGESQLKRGLKSFGEIFEESFTILKSSLTYLYCTYRPKLAQPLIRRKKFLQIKNGLVK